MKKFNSHYRAAVVALSLIITVPPGLAVEPGQRAPDFELPGAQGTVRLSDYKGKTVYLDFWASWCVPCRQSFPWMNEMQSRYRAQGLLVLAINVDQKTADAKKFLDRVPAEFEVGYDHTGLTPKAYSVKAMPSSFLIDASGKVVAVHRGFSNDDRPALEQALRRALNLKGEKP